MGSENARLNHNNCDPTFLVYKNSEHVKKMEREESGILGSIGEFCGAFYHRPEDLRKSMVCLDPNTCIVSKRSIDERNKKVNPKTAVALVKYEIEEIPMYWKRYTNCFEHKVHAEEFFKNDIIQQIEKELLNRTAKGLITMYITMQPCNLSTSDTRGTLENYSCCKFLKEVIERLPVCIKIHIKPTHLCKAGWKPTTKEKMDNMGHVDKEKAIKRNKEIANAEKGIKDLASHSRIKFSAMNVDDWADLWRHVNKPKNLKRVPGEERMAFDAEISEKLEDWARPHQQSPH